MTCAELRAALDELGITQADFARAVGITPRAVTHWVAGTRHIPGPIDAFLRVVRLMPPSARFLALNGAVRYGAVKDVA